MSAEPAEPLDAALRALSHPVRRDLVRLCGRGEHTVGEIAELAGLRQPAASRHLRVLRDAGLVHTEPRGNARLYHVDFERLSVVETALRDLWASRLPQLKAASPKRAGTSA